MNTFKKPIPLVNLATQQKRIRHKIDEAIARVLDHGMYIMGPEVSKLEQDLAKFTGAKHVITCSNGTDALLLALMAKNLQPGQAVLLPSFTFSATAEAVAYLGAIPYFVDVCSRTFNLDISSLKLAYQEAHEQGYDVAGLISVDLFGQPCDYDAIETWRRQKNIWLICDAAQSLGSTYRGKSIGSIGDITTTSFYPAKPLGCYGDGGAVFTDDNQLASIMRSLRVHGEGSNKYDNVRVGMNARLDTIQAAILLEKLNVFPDEILQRQALANAYQEHLPSMVVTPWCPDDRTSTWAQYTIMVPDGCRGDIQRGLSEQGIGTCVYYPIPLHKQLAYRHYPRVSQMTNCMRLAENVLSLPIALDSSIAVDVAGALNDTLKHMANA
ncbi:MAG: DegT/DnrJ/EryC1/StrS family aminotransferase [Pseudomonadota bacterium]|nr:DegT/DnrJ/EryC1/StrS family aminotransferase [Pseudomonadota bacterium]